MKRKTTTMITVGVSYAINSIIRRPEPGGRSVRPGGAVLPDEEARPLMFKIHTKGYNLSDIDFNELATWTEGYSASDISLICREALMTPIRSMDQAALLEGANPRAPNRNDFLEAIQTIRPSVAPQELVRYRNWEKEFGTA